jgi:malonyl-CoA O-methyltransferase
MAALGGRAAYDLWADTYPAVAHNPLMRVEQEVVQPLLAQLRATRALDLGTGSGRYATVLRSIGSASVVGVDYSLAMLARGGGRRVCADACRLPFRRGAFDLINASLMAGDVEHVDPWVRETGRALAAGGHLVYSDFHPSWAQLGWRRTFRTAAGEQHDVSFHPHTIDDHLNALERAGLRIRAIREPRFGDDADPDVKAFRRRWGNPRVIVVFHAVKEP